MRILLPALALLLAAIGTAAAQRTSSHTYTVTFEEITNSCAADVGLRLEKGQVELRREGTTMRISLPGVPGMNGRVRKGGSFKAEAEKRDPGTQSVEGRFSATGRASDDKVQLVFVAEFYRDKKPLCTQSWDVTGSKK